jgi:hypothetical protein
MKGTARRDQHRCDGSPSQSRWRKADGYYWDDNEDGWMGVRRGWESAASGQASVWAGR